MDKNALKELLRDYLDIQLWTEYDVIDDCYSVHAAIIFDRETISEDSFNMDCI